MKKIVIVLIVAMSICLSACSSDDYPSLSNNDGMSEKNNNVQSVEEIVYGNTDDIIKTLYPDYEGIGDEEKFYTEIQEEKDYYEITIYEKNGAKDFLPSEATTILTATVGNFTKEDDYLKFMKTVEYVSLVPLTDALNAHSSLDGMALQWNMGNWEYYYSGPSIYIEDLKTIVPLIDDNLNMKESTGYGTFVGGNRLNITLVWRNNDKQYSITMRSDYFIEAIMQLGEIIE